MAIPAPPGPARSRSRIVLTVVAVLLGVALAVVAGAGQDVIGGLRHEVSGLRADRDAAARAADSARAHQRDALRDAALPDKLQRVRDLDRAVDTAFARWGAGTVKFGVLDDAMDACYDAVDAYDRAAAPFPTDLLGGLPQAIDLTHSETDCGRSLTDRI